MPWPKTGATNCYAQLGLPDKGHIIKRLVVCSGLCLGPLDLLNGLALGYYLPSPEVLIVLLIITGGGWPVWAAVQSFGPQSVRPGRLGKEFSVFQGIKGRKSSIVIGGLKTICAMIGWKRDTTSKLTNHSCQNWLLKTTFAQNFLKMNFIKIW